MTRRARTGIKTSGWLVAAALVVLATRVLVYALVPRPSLIGTRLEHATGGPRLVVLTALALAIAGAVTTAVIWIVSSGVTERRKLEPLAVAPTRISPFRVALYAVVLWFVCSLAFAGVESFVHWRAGLGWHGLHCLTGPVHRDATPILGALSLIVAALVEAATHLLAWVRRIVHALCRRPSRPRSSVASTSCPEVFLPARSRCGDTRLGPRAPPIPSLFSPGGAVRRRSVAPFQREGDRQT